MSNKLIRVDDDVHARIAKLADVNNKSAGEVVAYLLRKADEALGGVPLPVLQRKRTKPYEEPRYGVNLKTMRDIPVRMPAGRKEGISLPDDLSGGVEAMDENGFWLEAKSHMCKILAHLAGVTGDIKTMRMSVVPFLREIKTFIISVSEESTDVFIPADIEAQKILHIISAAPGEYKEKQYYTAADLYLLWHCGFEIRYVETI
jgi:hypothetical protein